MIDIIDDYDEYCDIYAKVAVKVDENYFKELNDAELRTADFNYRHGQPPFRNNGANKALGALRWKGVFEYRDFVREMLGGRGVDFGGAAGPIHASSIVVDLMREDSLGRAVTHSNITGIPGKLDYIFSSHCLEHIPKYRSYLKLFRKKLKPDGVLFLHLPAYTCRRWRPSGHNSAKYGKHHWEYCIGSDKRASERSVPIDVVANKFFSIIECRYVGDNSIILIGNPI